MKYYRHKTTGTVYVRMVPGHGGMCTVTTMKGSTFVTRISNVEEIANDSVTNHTELQTLDVTDLAQHLQRLDFKGKFALASRLIPTVDLGTHLIICVLAGEEVHEIIFPKNAIRDFTKNVEKFLEAK